MNNDQKTRFPVLVSALHPIWRRYSQNYEITQMFEDEDTDHHIYYGGNELVIDIQKGVLTIKSLSNPTEILQYIAQLEHEKTQRQLAKRDATIQQLRDELKLKTDLFDHHVMSSSEWLIHKGRGKRRRQRTADDISSLDSKNSNHDDRNPKVLDELLIGPDKRPTPTTCCYVCEFCTCTTKCMRWYCSNVCAQRIIRPIPPFE